MKTLTISTHVTGECAVKVGEEIAGADFDQSLQQLGREGCMQLMWGLFFCCSAALSAGLGNAALREMFSRAIGDCEAAARKEMN